LLRAPAPGAVYAGLPLPTVVSRDAVPWDLPANARIRQFIAEAGLAELEAPQSALIRLRGANTPAELELLRRASPIVETRS
jgi:molybdopterin-guanine dinucleotide biosynthesis protein A